MHGTQALGLIQPIIRRFWFHGYTFNSTAASRVALTVDTDKIKNGYVFCFDPQAYTDVATLPTAMVICGQGGVDGFAGGTATTAIPNYSGMPGRYVVNVTKPTTGILPNFAGIVTGLPPGGVNTTQSDGRGYLDTGGRWIDLITWGPCLAWTHANMTYGVTGLGTANADWGLAAPTTSIASGAANLAALSLIQATALKTVDTSSTAALQPVMLGMPGRIGM